MKSEEHFFTIGYEGRKIEDYIKSLLTHGVKVLIDVRRNPISRKKGFSKNSLAGFLRNELIDYIHMPELGISSDQRKNIKTDDDYKKLFIHYKKNELAENKTSWPFVGGGYLRVSCDQKNSSLDGFTQTLPPPPGSFAGFANHAMFAASYF